MRSSLSHSDSEKLVTEIEGLRRLSPEELDQRWQRLFESERPNRMCGSLLRQTVAYRLQEKS
jgi:nitrate reductase assembly molybdenum cofactor insertion protein NarJ